MEKLDKSKIWQATLALWAVASLSFMAGMGLGSAVFTLFSLYFLFKDKKTASALFKSKFAYATYLYFFAACLSILFMFFYPPLGLPLEISFDLKKFHFFLLPFLAAACLMITSGPAMRFEKHLLWKALYWMALFVSVLGFLQFWGAYIFPAHWLTSRFFRVAATGNVIAVYHAQGLMFFHLSFATAISFSCAYAWARVIWPLQEDRGRQRLQWIILALLSAMALFYSFSRISWLALAAIFIVLGFLKRPRWGFAAILIMFLLFSTLWTFSDSMRGRVILGWSSLFERENVWQASLEMVKDRPLTGVGFGKTGYYSTPYAQIALGHNPYFSSHSHNNFLDIIASTGLIGFLAFLFWWAILWRYAWKSFCESPENERWLPAACLAAFVAFHINGLTQVNFFDAKSQHSLMLWAGIILALEWRRKKRAA